MADVEASGTDWNGAVSRPLTLINARALQSAMLPKSDRAQGNLQDVTDAG